MSDLVSLWKDPKYKNIIPEHVLYWIEFLSEIEESNKADNN